MSYPALKAAGNKYMSVYKESLPYLEETFPMYTADFDRSPRVTAMEVDALTEAVLEGQISEDGYVRSATAEQILAVSNSREPMNARNITGSLHKVQNKFTAYQRNGYNEPPANEYSRSLIKLVTHLVAPYTDQQYFTEQARHIQMADDIGKSLHRRLGFESVVTGGSLADTTKSLWHPFYSDIDIIGLRTKADLLISLDDITAEYAEFSNPKQAPWIYVNYGGKVGIDGLFRDPYTAMFSVQAERTEVESKYLQRLFASGYKHVTGDKDVTTRYFNAL